MGNISMILTSQNMGIKSFWNPARLCEACQGGIHGYLCVWRETVQGFPFKFLYKVSSSKYVLDCNFTCGSWNMKLFIP